MRMSKPVTQRTLLTHPNKGVSILSPVSCCLTIMITRSCHKIPSECHLCPQCHARQRGRNLLHTGKPLFWGGQSQRATAKPRCGVHQARLIPRNDQSTDASAPAARDDDGGASERHQTAGAAGHAIRQTTFQRKQ